MGRPYKTGIDYFSFDVDFFSDRKIRRIIKSCGAVSISILTSLLCDIYKGKGYFTVWDDDLPFDIADVVGASERSVLETIKKALQVNFFNQELCDKFQILTSPSIQERYLEACGRRKSVDIIHEFLLIELSSDFMLNANIKLVNVNNNLVNVDINSINDDRSTQSKVNESKLNNNKEENKENVVAGEVRRVFKEKFGRDLPIKIAEALCRDFSYKQVLCNIKRIKVAAAENPIGYLQKSLKENWNLALTEDEKLGEKKQLEKLQKEEDKRRDKALRDEHKKDELHAQDLKCFYNGLNQSEQANILKKQTKLLSKKPEFIRDKEMTKELAFLEAVKQFKEQNVAEAKDQVAN